MSQPIYLFSQDQGLLKHWQNCLGQDAKVLRQIDAELPADAVLILDLAHPYLAHRDASQWEHALNAIATITTSTNPNDEEAYRLLCAGARAYCQAAAPSRLLAQVVDVVKSGEIWAGRSLVQRILNAIKQLPAQKPSLDQLSEREKETALYAAKGYANKEIARLLAISERTVKAHLTRCFDKLGVSDRVQLTLRVNGIN